MQCSIVKCVLNINDSNIKTSKQNQDLIINQPISALLTFHCERLKIKNNCHKTTPMSYEYSVIPSNHRHLNNKLDL